MIDLFGRYDAVLRNSVQNESRAQVGYASDAFEEFR